MRERQIIFFLILSLLLSVLGCDEAKQMTGAVALEEPPDFIVEVQTVQETGGGDLFGFITEYEGNKLAFSVSQWTRQELGCTLPLLDPSGNPYFQTDDLIEIGEVFGTYMDGDTEIYIAEIVTNLTRPEIDYSCPSARITVTNVINVGNALVYADYEGEEVLIGTPDDKIYPIYDVNGIDNFKVGDTIEIQIVDDYVYDGRFRTLLVILLKNITRPEVVYEEYVPTN